MNFLKLVQVLHVSKIALLHEMRKRDQFCVHLVDCFFREPLLF